MLKRPERKATARPKPASVIGVAKASVSVIGLICERNSSALKLNTDPRNIASYAP